MSETLEQTVPTDAAGSRLDKWLIQQEAITISRSMLQSLMEQGAVLVNDQPVAKNYKVKAQDKVAVTIPEPVSLSLEPENIPLDIVYEDDDLLVVNKPKGMVVHPAPGNLTGTLVHALLYHCGDRLSSINGVIRPGIVHRIDKNTSGLLMVAKTDFAHHALSAQIQAHTFTREYQAICIGHLKEASGTICAPIGRHPVDRKKMCVTQPLRIIWYWQNIEATAICGCGWRLEERIKFEYTWHMWDIHFWEMMYMGQRSKAWRDSVCMPERLDSCIPLQVLTWNLNGQFRNIFRHCWIGSNV